MRPTTVLGGVAGGAVLLALMSVSGAAEPDLTRQALDDVVDQYCASCHSDRRMTGNLSLEGFDVENPLDQAATAEKIIRKLRAGMMPPVPQKTSGFPR